MPVILTAVDRSSWSWSGQTWSASCDVTVMQQPYLTCQAAAAPRSHPKNAKLYIYSGIPFIIYVVLKLYLKVYLVHCVYGTSTPPTANEHISTNHH
jgi:hypothetical protein